MIKMTGAALCGAALSVSAASIAFNTPVQWGTFRTNEIKASFVADSSLIGKQVQLTLTENTGSEKVIGSKSIAIKDLNNEIAFAVPTNISGGTNYFALKWKAADQEGAVAPFAIAPVAKGIDPTAAKAATLNGEPSVSNIASSGATHLKAGTADVALGWTPSALAISAQGTGVVTINLDLDNSKSAFVSFSDRTITIDFDKKSIAYSYNSRKAKEFKVIYTSEKWSGDMKGSVTGTNALVTIPWYDLGVKPFSGRQFGILINQAATKFPATAQETNPSTWGNILLK